MNIQFCANDCPILGQVPWYQNLTYIMIGKHIFLDRRLIQARVSFTLNTQEQAM
jgi:hypothetical protein